MSIEVNGFDPSDRRYLNTISAAAGMLCAGQGIESEAAYSIGVSGAEYGMAVALTALRQMGVWPPENFDASLFEIRAREIVNSSLNPHQDSV